MSFKNTCKKCKADIPFGENKCPSCGAKQIPLYVSILVWILLVIGAYSFFSWWEDNTWNEVKAPLTIEQKIEKQFSPWDGSHVQLKKYVIETLKDPKSFEHIETTFTPKPLTDETGNEYITVNMQYRAKNSFWGYVVETYKAFFDIEGGPVRIEEWSSY